MKTKRELLEDKLRPLVRKLLKEENPHDGNVSSIHKKYANELFQWFDEYTNALGSVHLNIPEDQFENTINAAYSKLEFIKKLLGNIK